MSVLNSSGDENSRGLLDACLIVKNEECNLPGCLASLARLRPLLGKVYVYDTGSTDASVRVARAAGAEVAEGYWDNDFARARNEALAMASAEWVLAIDADEQVHVDTALLREVLEASEQVDVFNASFDHVDASGAVIGHSSYAKIVRPRSVRYRGRIHEVPIRLNGHPVRSCDLPPTCLTFRHTGYATAEVRLRKARRNAVIAEQEVADARVCGDRSRLAEALYHHARSVLRLGRGQEAIEGLNSAWEEFKPGSVGRARVALQLVSALLSEGEEAKAIAVVKQHMRDGGSSGLARLLLADVAAHGGRDDEALEVLAGINLRGESEDEVHPRDVLSRRIAILDRLGRRDEALATCLVLVGGHGEVGRAGELLRRADSVDPAALADLLREAGGGGVSADLRSALLGSGALGEKVADAL